MISTERETTTWARWPLTINHGDAADLETVEVAAVSDPDLRPGDTDWVAATVTTEQHDLWREDQGPEVVLLVGPASGERVADLQHDGEGSLQVWTRWQTADESVVERSATWEVS